MIEIYIYLQGIFSFMRWVERCIVEEVEVNEDFEKCIGESFVLKELMYLLYNFIDY